VDRGPWTAKWLIKILNCLVHVIVEWHWQVISAKMETLIVTYKYV